MGQFRHYYCRCKWVGSGRGFCLPCVGYGWGDFLGGNYVSHKQLACRRLMRVMLRCSKFKDSAALCTDRCHCVILDRVGQDHIYVRCTHGIFGREITKFTVIYGAYISFWPTLLIIYNNAQQRKHTFVFQMWRGASTQSYF